MSTWIALDTGRAGTTQSFDLDFWDRELIHKALMEYVDPDEETAARIDKLTFMMGY
jgi:hypothetical protein